MTIFYGEQTQRTVETMSFSGQALGHFPDYVKNLCYVKLAAAQANHELGLLSSTVASSIVSACRMVIESFDPQQFPVDIGHGGGGIGINVNVNEVIASIANNIDGGSVHPITDVNLSQSTADVCHTGLRMTILRSLDTLNGTLETASDILRTRQQEFDGMQTIARTCMMDAMAVNMGDRFSGFADVLQRRSEVLQRTTNRFKTINLGGTVIGSGQGTVPGYPALVLKYLNQEFDTPLVLAKNLYDATQNIDDLVQLTHDVSNLAQVLIKLSNNLRFLSSGPEAGIGELNLPKTQSGSSFFPGKVNPVIPEMMMQCGFLVMGLTGTIESCQIMGEPDINVFEEFAGFMMLNQLDMLNKALSSFVTFCLSGIEVNEEKCRRYAHSLMPTITELTQEFGYGPVSEIINRSVEERTNIRDALRDMQIGSKTTME